MTDFAFHFQIIRSEKSPSARAATPPDTLNYRICRQEKRKINKKNQLMAEAMSNKLLPPGQKPGDINTR